ncbi:monodechloroaminopyrrolnitrin synthase PrnB family protein [Massilia sp. W12]|uniref:PrnB family protein n=1 Tax=Massilia sp. W12 TaxID=3126507 RepID=UPI0030D59FDB
MMTENVHNFDAWIRSRFCELNTALENLYFAQERRADVAGVGSDLKRALCLEGQEHIRKLVQEGNTDEGFDQAFNLLGNVGFYMAACNRHGVTEQDAGPAAQMREASALALELGANLGVTPRFATSHLTTHNFALQGRYKSFTSLEDEYIFIDYNTIGILAYKRAADALLRLQPMGVTHPVATSLLRAAKAALDEVIESNAELFKKLDVERFFYSVRPYYKPHAVGFQVYRGANAGDFAGINVIDLLLGLCQSRQSSYSQLLVDKFLFMMPNEQLILRDCMRQPNYMDLFLQALDAGHDSPAFRRNLALFVQVCQAHGQGSSMHHDQLVHKYIAKPADDLPPENHDKLTASGPPLPVLLRALQNLRDQRAAVQRDDIPTRYADLQRLQATLAAWEK